MPTPGPWQDGWQVTVPGVAAAFGRRRGKATGAAENIGHPEVDTDAEVDALFNNLRLVTDGGTVDAGTVDFFGSICGGSVTHISDPGGVSVTGFNASDQGWFFVANTPAAWTDYRNGVASLAFTAGASGWEIEGGDVQHQTIDSASIEIPVVVVSVNDNPITSIRVDIYTMPAGDQTDIGGVGVRREQRDLVTTGIGTTTLDPVSLNLGVGDFDPAFGGVQVYPHSRQAPDDPPPLPPWNVNYDPSAAGTVASITFRNEGTTVATYQVTWPRYRLLFDEEIPTAEPTVTRQWPRDDALGSMGSGTRIYPPPRRGRVYPAQL